MSHSIALIIPYFGKLPGYFHHFLASVRHNPTIDVFLYTDDRSPYDYPPNVIVKYETFGELVERIQRNFDFRISCEAPYKLCDYKPAYGVIFADDLAGYDVWGYCDIDMVFGNLRNFITDELIDTHDKLFEHGHLTLFRNESENNRRFMEPIQEDGWEFSYKTVFSNYGNFSFGEDKLCAKVWRGRKVHSAYATSIADIQPFFSNFSLYTGKLEPQLFRIAPEGLTGYRLLNGALDQKEYLYLHFQVRKLAALNGSPESFLVAPDRFLSDTPVTADLVRSAGWLNLRFERSTDYLKKRLGALERRLAFEWFGLKKGIYTIPKRKTLSPSNSPFWTPIAKRSGQHD